MTPEQRLQYHSRAAAVLQERRNGVTLVQIARNMGISRERVRQLEATAIRREQAADQGPVAELPTYLQNALHNLLYHVTNGQQVEITPANVSAHVKTEAGLLGQYNIGKCGVAHIQAWLQRHGIEPLTPRLPYQQMRFKF